MQLVLVNGRIVDFDAAVALMDDEIREAVHAHWAEDLDDPSPQAFIDQYCAWHQQKYGETFQVN